jgi:acyl-CoA reductase-like NAD-dependent aldehyde dehydrogenase
MTELLTRDEYAAIADQLHLPGSAFINGQFTPAGSSATFATVNPATGKTLNEIAHCDEADVDRAVAKAREALQRGVWSSGSKQSGFGGRDNSIHAHDQYTELKTIWLDLSDGQEHMPLD